MFLLRTLRSRTGLAAARQHGDKTANHRWPRELGFVVVRKGEHLRLASQRSIGYCGSALTGAVAADSLTAACTYLAQGCALFNHIGRLGREQPLQRLDDAATCAEGLSELVVAQCDVCERSSGDLSRGIRAVDQSHTSTGHVGRHRIAQRLSAASLPPSLVWPQPARSVYGSSSPVE